VSLAEAAGGTIKVAPEVAFEGLDRWPRKPVILGKSIKLPLIVGSGSAAVVISHQLFQTVLKLRRQPIGESGDTVSLRFEQELFLSV
jgi:hypothetical protein